MGNSKGKIQRRGTSEPVEEKTNDIPWAKLNLTRNSINLEDMKNDNPRLKRRVTSEPLEYASLALKRKNYVTKMAPKKAKTISNNLPSERVKSSTPQMSMKQIGKSMSKSGPRKNIREAVASVKGKLKKAYSKVIAKKKG